MLEKNVWSRFIQQFYYVLSLEQAPCWTLFNIYGRIWSVIPSCAFWDSMGECTTCRILWLCSCTVCLKCGHDCASCGHLSWRNDGHNHRTRIWMASHLKRNKESVLKTWEINGKRCFCL